MTCEIKAIPCPVPYCQGFVKFNDEDEPVCDLGHLLSWEQVKEK
jgi:hypothetical protein